MEWKEIFRTFCRGGGSDGKRSIEKHKGVEKVRSWEDASQFDSFGGILQAGWVDISFDDPDMSEAFLEIAEEQEWKCLALQNRANRHIHTYWRDSQHRIQKYTKDLTLACGFVADIHGGDTYIPLQCKGEARFPPVYDIFEGEDYQEVPDALMPVSTATRLWKMAEGDGRNDDLFSYILVLQRQLGMDADAIRKLYTEIINPHILAQPLGESELATILRDDAFRQDLTPSFYNGKVFQFDVFAQYLEERSHVVMINGQLHIYKDGVYVHAQRDVEKQIIDICPKLRKTQRKEVMDYLQLIAPDTAPADPDYIAFENGVLDIGTGQLMPYTPDLIITNKIPWAYDPNAQSDLCSKTLDRMSCGDKDIRAILEECAGACMYRSALLAGGKAFILTGGRANGKSTFLDMIKAMLGQGNYAALDLKEIGDRFSTSMIAGKLANIGDDISDDFLQGQQVSVFKKVVTGNTLKAEDKGMDPYDFSPYCKLLFSANDIPRMRDKTGAVMRRIIIIPFNNYFAKTLPDGTINPLYQPGIIRDLTSRESIQYLIRRGVEGLRRVIDAKAYTDSTKVQQQMDEYELENNPILGFIQDEGADNIINQPTGSVYRRYQVFCQDSQVTPMSKFIFSKQINKRLNFKIAVRKIDGKNHRVFEREEG